MIQNVLKHINKLIVLGVIAFTPFCLNASSENTSIEFDEFSENFDARLSNKISFVSKKQKKFIQAIHALESFVIDGHDFYLASLWNKDINDFTIENDIQSIVNLFVEKEKGAAQVISNIFNNFFFLGAEYANSIGSNPCFTSDELSNSRSAFLESAQAIADFINALIPVNSREAKELNALFEDLALSQLENMNNMAPSCANPKVPVDLTVANNFYSRTRFIAAKIAAEIAERINKSNSCKK
ncbi:MAG: hypothetical protein H0W88_01575 [Parachlamydiaceae bacterium]|nr:hypothetical protein [Parachlamydiaceae bacterium]